MDKILVLKDSSRHRLNPLTFQEFIRANYCTDCKAVDTLEAYNKFKAVNGYVDLEDLAGGGVLSDAKIEVYDGGHELTWNVHSEKWQVVHHEYKGFPSDDEMSLQQGCHGTGDLSMFYAHQFAQDEEVKADVSEEPNSLMQGDLDGCGNLDIYYDSKFVMNEEVQKSNIETISRHVPLYLEKTPLLKGTMTGTIYVDDTLVQTFYHSSNGSVSMTEVGEHDLYAEEIKINEVTGEIDVIMNELVDRSSVKLVVNYEYNLECQQEPPPGWKYPPGYPTDDMCALQQMASGDCNLYSVYPFQFVQNENVIYSQAKGPEPHAGWRYHKFSMLPLKYGPVLKDSFGGSIYVKDEFVAVFHSDFQKNSFIIKIDGNNHGEATIKDITFDYDTGRFNLSWAGTIDPTTVKMVVSYEYDYANENNVKYLQPLKTQITIE